MSSAFDGPSLSAQDYTRLEQVVDAMQVLPSSIKRLGRPIGRGGAATVYKVEHKGQVRAAKVRVTTRH